MYGHVALTKECLVAVGTAGLHDSTSWKMAEYLAASRCIVSERPFYDSAAPLVEGKHYLAFTTPAECVAACERLLDDPETARALRAASYAYYSAHVRPDQVLRSCLAVALQRSGAQVERASAVSVGGEPRTRETEPKKEVDASFDPADETPGYSVDF